MFLSFSSTHGCPVHDPWPFGGPRRQRQKQNRDCWITDGAWRGCAAEFAHAMSHDCPCRAHGVWPRGGTLLPWPRLPAPAPRVPVPPFFFITPAAQRPSPTAGQKPHLTPFYEYRRDSNPKNERKQQCLARLLASLPETAWNVLTLLSVNS